MKLTKWMFLDWLILSKSYITGALRARTWLEATADSQLFCVVASGDINSRKTLKKVKESYCQHEHTDSGVFLYTFELWRLHSTAEKISIKLGQGLVCNSGLTKNQSCLFRKIKIDHLIWVLEADMRIDCFSTKIVCEDLSSILLK